MAPAPEPSSRKSEAKIREASLCQQVMMVRPTLFGWNEETAASNRFQKASSDCSESEIQARALAEFESLRTALADAHIQVHDFTDSLHPPTPDSIFPNNWVSFHGDGSVVLYPMQTPNRRAEIRTRWVEELERSLGEKWTRLLDLRPLCEQGHYLEGTGSMVLDRANKVAFAALSPRTTQEGLDAFAKGLGYKIHALRTSVQGLPVYHTNVMMSLGRSHAVACLQAIPSVQEQRGLLGQLEQSGRQVLEIDRDQMHHFAGNQITLMNDAGDPHIIMSKQALDSLRPSQVHQLERHGAILAPCLKTVEHHGGGSARCMLAEIFPPASAEPA